MSKANVQLSKLQSSILTPSPYRHLTTFSALSPQDKAQMFHFQDGDTGSLADLLPGETPTTGENSFKKPPFKVSGKCLMGTQQIKHLVKKMR